MIQDPWNFNKTKNVFDELKEIADYSLDFIFDSFNMNNKNLTESTYHIENGEVESRIYVEVPGINKKDITIKIDNHILNIEYPKKKFYETKSPVLTKLSFKIGSQIDIDNIQSTLENGILLISINKMMDKKDTSRTIEIK